MLQIKKQLHRLLALEWVGYFRPAGTIWVLLLAARGFSLAEIGLAEGVFHLVSLCGEVPSGVCADLLGRRRTLAASQLVLGLSAVTMLLSQGFGGVLAAMAFSALGYNLASGTREALAYDSLLEVGEEAGYLALSSRLNVVYRLSTAAATLCAGLTVLVGWRVGYAVDALLSLAGGLLALTLTEPALNGAPRETAPLGELGRRLKTHLWETGRFLRENPRAVGLMLFNALVGAGATLLGFYLQDGLPGAGAPKALLGPLLLAVGLGGVVGSRLAPLLGRMKYGGACVLCSAGVAAGYLLVGPGLFPIMTLGGFLAAACDDGLQILTDARLNEALPSDRRATLLSVSSLCFSLVMVVLSPLAGLAVS